MSTFIGRECEIGEVKQLLSANRLVTLTGAGESGKTRLAFKVANELHGEFEHGVWLTEFAALSDVSLAPQAVALTLGVREQQSIRLVDVLVNFLHQRHILLVFDNCEHLVDACAQLAEILLQACPDLTILATSREPLSIPSEAVWNVPPLTLPAVQPWHDPLSRAVALSAYRQSEAVQLFLACASSISPDFILTTENGSWVAEICRRLDYDLVPNLDHCFDNPGVGGMGFHYINTSILDTTVDLLKPEAMVYAPGPNGQLQLGAVEYIVPAEPWDTANSQPPQLLDQTFHLNTDLGVYVLHAWIWKNNPSGMFEDWNPKVSCP